MRGLFFVILLFGSTVFLNAQQQTNFTQFYSNDIIFNPAVSGSKTYNPLVLQTRQQWLGFEGAPLSTSISYHKLIDQNNAFGGIFNFEQTYPSIKIELQPTYAFHVPLNSKTTTLSFGLAPSLMYYSINFDLEDLPQNQDPAFSGSTYSSASIDFIDLQSLVNLLIMNKIGFEERIYSYPEIDQLYWNDRGFFDDK